jgi:hypothetical protein
MEPYVIFLSLAILIFVLTFPWSFLLESNELKERDINIIDYSLFIENLLINHKNIFTEEEYISYKGYIYKVLTYSNHYLDINNDLYLPIISTALVYHDYHLLSNRLGVNLAEYLTEHGSNEISITNIDIICNYVRVSLNEVYNHTELILITNIIKNYDNIRRINGDLIFDNNKDNNSINIIDAVSSFDCLY